MKTRAIRFRVDQEAALKRQADKEKHGNISRIVQLAVDLHLGLVKPFDT